jgi:hypothetical protein
MARRRAPAAKKGSTRKFVSKAQWGYLHHKFGHTGFVKTWARRNKRSRPYKSLPKRRTARRR